MIPVNNLISFRPLEYFKRRRDEMKGKVGKGTTVISMSNQDELSLTHYQLGHVLQRFIMNHGNEKTVLF